MQDDEVEDDLSESLKSLRRNLFTWQGRLWAILYLPIFLFTPCRWLVTFAATVHHADWAEVEPLEYLAPFLDVIKSPETSGTVTDVALNSVLNILRSNVLGESCYSLALLKMIIFPEA